MGIDFDDDFEATDVDQTEDEEESEDPFTTVYDEMEEYSKDEETEDDSVDFEEGPSSTQSSDSLPKITLEDEEQAADKSLKSGINKELKAQNGDSIEKRHEDIINKIQKMLQSGGEEALSKLIDKGFEKKSKVEKESHLDKEKPSSNDPQHRMERDAQNSLERKGQHTIERNGQHIIERHGGHTIERDGQHRMEPNAESVARKLSEILNSSVNRESNIQGVLKSLSDAGKMVKERGSNLIDTNDVPPPVQIGPADRGTAV